MKGQYQCSVPATSSLSKLLLDLGDQFSRDDPPHHPSPCGSIDLAPVN